MSSTPSTPPHLVESLADLSAGDVEVRLREALARADLVELRLDRLPQGSLAQVPATVRHQVIATCRAAWEGGAWTGTEDARRQLLLEALDAGIRYVDVEWKADFRGELLARDAARVVLSMHDFASTPDDLATTIGAMAAAHPGVAKVAVTATCLRDVIRLRDAGRAVDGQPMVLISMGVHGVASRVLAGHLGSCWTYAGDGVAPGQVPAMLMREVYRVGQVTNAATVFAVAGRPIGHSLSPVLHNAAFAARGIDAVYIPLEGHDIDDVLMAADALEIRGLSVTAPFKEDALARSVSADGATRAIGAANTLTRSAAGWVATNTDVEGFLAPLRRRRVLRGARVSVLGAGGAARAVVVGLSEEGALVTVHARKPTRSEVVAALGGRGGAWPPAPGSWDILVNTTPVGTSPDVERTPLDAHALGEGLDGRIVYDLVYNPARTRLLTLAAAAGAETLGGLEMLVAQAARQFALWHGGAPPLDIMRAAVGRHAAHLVAHAEAACPE